MIYLIDENNSDLKMRNYLMCEDFQSIWVELEREFEKNVLIGGFYRDY